MSKYVVFRRDDYVVVTDEYERTQAALTKYKKMRFETRKKWLRQHGEVLTVSEILGNARWYIEKYCSNSIHGVFDVSGAVKCLAKSFESALDDILVNLVTMRVTKGHVERKPRKKFYLQLVRAYKHPALKHSKAISKTPRIARFRSSVWVWVDGDWAVSLSDEYIRMIDEDPERATEEAARFFEPGSWVRECFMGTDFSRCDLELCAKMRKLQMFLMFS